jgi:hypothetical protein
MGAAESHQSGGGNPTPENQQSQPARQRATSDLQDVMSGVDTIRQLEEEHRRRLDMVSAKRKALVEFQSTSASMVEAKVKALQEEKEDTKRINKELYQEEMAAVNKKKEAQLEELIQHVNTTVLEERRLMMREDVFAAVKRELEDAWEEGLALMKSEQQAALKKQTAITTTTYNKKYNEFKANLDSEYAEALRKHEEAKASSKKRSSSIFGWLSPNKRSRRGGEEEDDDDMDD